jgi:hypothetical protein
MTSNRVLTPEEKKAEAKSARLRSMLDDRVTMYPMNTPVGYELMTEERYYFPWRTR